MEAGEMLHQIVWGPWTLALFLGVGIWFTLRSGLFQIRGFFIWWSQTAGSFWNGNTQQKKEEGVTAFQSACTALAATIGTGNIAGVATALTAGGPGALFWMWISAFIGMATAYAETSLGQQYRYRDRDGHWVCGPMVYMERGLKCPALGILYAGLVVLSSLGMGSMVQSNSMSETLAFTFHIPTWLNGVVIVVLAGCVICGGIGRIAKVSEKLMPISAGIYMLFSLFVILSCVDAIPGIFQMIFREAFQIRAAAGGTAGYVLSKGVRYGLSRGVFSNEAGLGSLAVLHGSAEHTTPQQQGMWAMFEVFFDTIVICTMTALVILCVGQTWGVPGDIDGAALTAFCFSKRLGSFGAVLTSAAMAVFAFATIVAWFYLGKQTVLYLLERVCKNQRTKQAGEQIYLVLYLAAVFLGSVSRVELVWLLSDLWNGLMAFPNLFTLLLLSHKISFPERESEKKKPLS